MADKPDFTHTDPDDDPATSTKPTARLLSDADLLAWAVVMSYRARQERDGMKLLLLPYPPCPTCGAPVDEAKQVTLDRFVTLNIRLTLWPCGHIHETGDEYIRRLWVHIHEMLSDVVSGYCGHAQEARGWTTEDIAREARARVGAAAEGDAQPSASDEAATAEAELAKLREGLHKFRYALDSRAGRETTTDFIRAMLDAMLTDPGEPCDRDQQYARAEAAEAAIGRVRAEVARIRAVTRTWEPVADLIDAAIDGSDRAADEATEPERCCVCGGGPVTYRNFREQPFCWPCADCQCGQNPCVRTGVNDPAVAGPAASEPASSPLRNQIVAAIREFPFDNFGLDDVSYLLESEPDTQEWVPKLADAVLAVLDPHGDTGAALERGHRCFLENHDKRLAREESPTVGTARIALDVSAPGTTVGIAHITDAVRDAIQREARRARREAGDV